MNKRQMLCKLKFIQEIYDPCSSLSLSNISASISKHVYDNFCVCNEDLSKIRSLEDLGMEET